MAEKLNFTAIANHIVGSLRTNATINIQELKEKVTDKKKPVQSLVLALFDNALAEERRNEVVLAIKIYEFIFLYTNNQPPFTELTYNICSNSLSTLINDKHKQGVNKALNQKFLEICLPHSSEDVDVYWKAMYLYVEMEDYNNALKCLQQFSMEYSSLNTRKMLVDDLNNKDLFASFRKNKDVEQAINVEAYITQLVLDRIELDITGYYAILWKQIKQATSLGLNHLMKETYLKCCKKYISDDYRINFRLACFYTEVNDFDKAFSFLEAYFATNIDELDFYYIYSAVPEKQKMLYYLKNDSVFEQLRSCEKMKDYMEQWSNGIQEELKIINESPHYLSLFENYQMTNDYIDAVSISDNTAIEAIEEKLDEKSLQTLLNSVRLRANDQLYHLKQWDLTLKIFEQIYDFLEQKGHWEYCCLRALWLLQHDNTGLKIDQPRKDKFIAYSLPYAAKYPVIYFNIACLYIESEDYDKATDYFELYFTNDFSKEDRKQLLQQLENDVMFTQYRKTNAKDISKWKKNK